MKPVETGQFLETKLQIFTNVIKLRRRVVFLVPEDKQIPVLWKNPQLNGFSARIVIFTSRKVAWSCRTVDQKSYFCFFGCCCLCVLWFPIISSKCVAWFLLLVTSLVSAQEMQAKALNIGPLLLCRPFCLVIKKSAFSPVLVRKISLESSTFALDKSTVDAQKFIDRWTSLLCPLQLVIIKFGPLMFENFSQNKNAEWKSPPGLTW